MTINRRDFIKLTGATLACTCLGALGTGGCANKRTSDTPTAPVGSYRLEGDRLILTFSAVDALREVDGAVKVTVPDDEGLERKIILLHADKNTYLAFADRCTHNGKELKYLPAARKLACSGLRSRFDLAGQVVRGPAEGALHQYHIWHEGDELVIEI